MANTKPICGDLETYNDIMKRAKELDLVDINQIVAAVNAQSAIVAAALATASAIHLAADIKSSALSTA